MPSIQNNDWVISANQNPLCVLPCEHIKYRNYRIRILMDDLVNLSGLCDGFKIDGWIRANFEVICQERHNHNEILLILTRKSAP